MSNSIRAKILERKLYLKMSQSKWTNHGQFEMLIKLMELNPDIAKGFSSNKIDAASFWKDANEKLNSLGPPFKDATSWKKVWIDFKGNTKEKLIENEKKKKQSGCNDNNLTIFSPLEEDVIRITAINKAVEGVDARIFGILNSKCDQRKEIHNIPSTSKDVSDEGSDDEDQFSSPLYKECPIPVKRAKRASTADMLNRQQEIEMQHTATVASKLDSVISNLEKISKSLDESNNEKRRHNMEIEKLQRIKANLKQQILDSQMNNLIQS